MIQTTLTRIKEKEPCSGGWQKLLTYLAKTEADNEPLSLLTILKSNGVNDCLWAFRCTDDNESIYRHIAADFAESVLHIFEDKYPEDKRPRLAIQAARDFADGKIDDAARAAAVAAAWAAAVAAARNAGNAAGTAGNAAWTAGNAEKQKQYEILLKYLS